MAAALLADELEPEGASELDGRERPPLPDMGSSSSAKASKEMRSAAFLFGLLLFVSIA